MPNSFGARFRTPQTGAQAGLKRFIADSSPSSAQAAWDARLRTLEDAMLRTPGAKRTSAPAASPPAGVPSVGERRDFDVIGRDGQPDSGQV